jgi:DNA-binding XRE family transcriptional regulator
MSVTMTITEELRAQLHARRELPPPERRRELRQKARLSQQWVGDKVGVSREAIAMYEAGTRSGPRQGTPQRERYLDLLEALEELA